jgi:gliding motility-associated-like protein
MFMPHAFTPIGSSGINDEIRPMFVDDYGNTCAVKTGTWSVYNRWGECVFTGPLSEGWNGTYMNQQLPTGVYAYLINLTFDSSVTGFRNFSEKGTILLLDGNKN